MKQIVKTFGDLFSYDPVLGALKWKVNRPKRPVGSLAGNKKSDGRYITLHATINGIKKRYYAHRVIWELHNGTIPTGSCIDHIDGNGLNNKLDNLRVTSLSQNQRNRKISKNSRTGIHGVNHHSGGFTVSCAGKYIVFTKDFFLACCARKSAENNNEFHKNHGRAA